VIQVTFPAKTSLDEYSISENIGFFKNKLNLLKDLWNFRYSNVEVVRDFNTYGQNVRLTLGWEYRNTYDFNNLVDLVNIGTKIGFQNLDVSVDINQKISTNVYDSDEPKLTGKLQGNGKCNETRFNSFAREYVRENPYSPPIPSFFGLLLLSGNVDFRFHNLEDLIDSGMIPWPEGVPRFCGFRGLKDFVLPMVVEGLNNLPSGDMDLKNLIFEVYEKIFNCVQGVGEVKVGFKNHVLSLKFSGFDVFNGYFPPVETLRA